MAESKKKTEPDRYLQVCVKIHNFYRHLDDTLVERVRDEREKEGVRRCIGDLRRTFKEELRHARKRME